MYILIFEDRLAVSFKPSLLHTASSSDGLPPSHTVADDHVLTIRYMPRQTRVFCCERRLGRVQEVTCVEKK